MAAHEIRSKISTQDLCDGIGTGAFAFPLSLFRGTPWEDDRVHVLSVDLDWFVGIVDGISSSGREVYVTLD